MLSCIDDSCYIVLHAFMFRMLLGYISPLGICFCFVFTDEGDCMVADTFGSVKLIG